MDVSDTNAKMSLIDVSDANVKTLRMVVDVNTALRACDPDAVPGILNGMLEHREQPLGEEENTRLALLAKARDLVRALESPRETMAKHLWAQVRSESLIDPLTNLSRWHKPSCLAAITACYDLGVFRVMANGRGQPLKVTEIASKVGTNVDMLGRLSRKTCIPELLTHLGRLLKHIGAMGYIKETDADTYAPTNFSNALTIPIIGDGYPCLYVSPSS
jgi:hypothetical protein